MFVEVESRPVRGGQQCVTFPQDAGYSVAGGAFVHNLILGDCEVYPFDGRQTPFHKSHSTEAAGLHDNPCGDLRFYNNLLLGHGNLSRFDGLKLPVAMAGNVFSSAKPSKHETAPIVKPEFDPAVKLVEEAERILP